MTWANFRVIFLHIPNFCSNFATEFLVVPTNAFKQDILLRGVDVEVFYSQELRDKSKKEVKKMNKLYK